MNYNRRDGHLIGKLIDGKFDEEKSEEVFQKILNVIRYGTEEEFLYSIISIFVSDIISSTYDGYSNSIWIPRLFTAILNRPNGLEFIRQQINDLSRYGLQKSVKIGNDFIDRLLQEESILIPRKIREINNPVLSDRRISEIIGSYIHPEYIRHKANRNTIPYRTLYQSKIPAFSEHGIIQHIGSFNNTLNIPVLTPRRIKPKKAPWVIDSPRSPRPSGSPTFPRPPRPPNPPMSPRTPRPLRLGSPKR